MNLKAQNLSFSRNVPPTLEQVQAYFNSLQVPASEAEVFYFYYQGMDWENEIGSAIRDWIMVADDWVWNLENRLAPIPFLFPPFTTKCSNAGKRLHCGLAMSKM